MFVWEKGGEFVNFVGVGSGSFGKEGVSKLLAAKGLADEFDASSDFRRDGLASGGVDGGVGFEECSHGSLNGGGEEGEWGDAGGACEDFGFGCVEGDSKGGSKSLK